MTDNESDSFEEDEIIKKIMGHNFTSSRPQSQLFHKAPQKKIANSLKNSKKNSPIFSPKPRTTRTSMAAVKTPEEINSLAKQTSQQIIKSVYNLVSSKLPLSLLESSELSKKDQEEIQHFFTMKKTQFRHLLEEIFEKKNCEKRVVRDTIKSMQALENKYLQEIKQIQNKQVYMRTELVKKTSERILKEKTIVKKNKELEAKKKVKETKKIQRFEKDLIMKNIENFYKDRMDLIKTTVLKEMEAEKVQKYEEKKFISELVKEQKQNRMKRYKNIKEKYEQELEQLKDRFNSIH